MIAIPKLGMLLGFKAIARSQCLSAADKSVASAILDHYNHNTGRCDPSRETLATLLGVSVRSVSRSIAKIVKSGLFTVIRHGGVRQCNFYKPNWTEFEQIEKEWKRCRHRHSMRFVDQDLAPQPGHICHLPHDNNVPQTSSTNFLLSTFRPTPENRGADTSLSQVGSQMLSPDQKIVAENKADIKWNKDLIQIHGKGSTAYKKIIEMMTAEIYAQATQAELKRRGGGADFINQLLLMPKRVDL